MEAMEHEMKPTVRFPAFRREVILAVAAFADPDYQRRVWVEKVMPFVGYYDDLTVNVHALYDDFVSLPNARDYVGDVLVDGPEIQALIDLDSAFAPILAELGDAPDSAYLEHPQWSTVVRRARLALPALVLANAD